MNGIVACSKAMGAFRKFLAVVAAVLSILFIFLALRFIGLTLANYHQSSFFDEVASWSVVAVLVGLAFVLMKLAAGILR